MGFAGSGFDALLREDCSGLVTVRLPLAGGSAGNCFPSSGQRLQHTFQFVQYLQTSELYEST